MARVITLSGTPVLQDTWHIEDIVGKAEDRADPIALTDAQAVEIMHILARTHDASLGINWDVIDAAIDYWAETNQPTGETQ